MNCRDCLYCYEARLSKKKYLMCGIFQAEIKDPSKPLCKGHYFYPQKKEFEEIKPFWEEG